MVSKLSEDIKKEVFELTLALYRVTDFFPRNEVLRRSLREKANEIFGLVTEYGYDANFEAGALQIFARIEALKGYLDIARTMRLVKPINLSVLYREYEFLGQFFKNESRLSDIKHTSSRSNEGMSDGTGFTPRANSEAPGHKEGNKGVGFDVGDAGKSHLSKEHRFDTSAEKSSKRSVIQDSSRQNIGSQKSETGDKGHIRHSGEGDAITERQKAIIDHMKKGERKARLGDLHGLFSGVSSKTVQRDLQDLVFKNILRREGDKRWTTYFLEG